MIAEREKAITKKVSHLTSFDKEVMDRILETPDIKSTRHFNFEECKELMPWKQAVIENDILKQWESGQLEFEGTQIAKTARIKVVTSRQVRAQKVDQQNARDVGNSLEVNNWISKLPRIIVIESTDPNYDYELILGFTRFQEIGRLQWEELPVDVISAPPLIIAEISSDSNLHIGKGGLGNTPESIWNLALKMVDERSLADDDAIVKDWIFERARDKKDEVKEKIFRNYQLRRPSTSPMQTFHQDKNGENSIKVYCKVHKMFENNVGIVRGDGDSASGWNSITQMIMKHPYKKKIWGMWVPEPNQNTLAADRKKQLTSAKNFHLEKANVFAKVYKLVQEQGKNPLNPEHIVKYGFNIECRHVAQDTTPDPSKSGAPKEEGWVD
jgi:hypothetical protein